jgi:NADH dehydrogenase
VGRAQLARNKKKVVILGGGFSGVECARQLESKFGNDPDVELVMVSEDNFLLFTPMLPQVASGMIETRHIVLPIRTILQQTQNFSLVASILMRKRGAVSF